MSSYRAPRVRRHASEVVTYSGWLVAVAIVASAYLYGVLFVFPTAVPFARMGDEAIPVMDAVRMSEGQVIYLDFFQFLPPGTSCIALLFLKVFGPVSQVPSLITLCLGSALVVAATIVASALLSKRHAALAGLLVLLNFDLSATHQWFSTVLVLIGIALLIHRRTNNKLVPATVLFAFAFWFTPPRGIAAFGGLVLILAWESRAKGQPLRRLLPQVGRLALLFSLTSLFLNLPFLIAAGPKHFIDSTVVFPALHYSADVTFNSWHAVGLEAGDALRHPYSNRWCWIEWSLLGSCAAGLLIDRRRIQKLESEARGQVLVLTVMALALLASVGNAPIASRIATVSPACVVLLVWMLSLRRTVFRVICVLAVMAVVVRPIRLQSSNPPQMILPAGSVAFGSPDELTWTDSIAAQTKPGDYFFDAYAGASTHFVLGLKNPGPILAVAANGYTTRDHAQQVLAALESHDTRLIAWPMNPKWGYAPGPDSQLSPVFNYVRRHYRPTETISPRYEWHGNDFTERLWQKR